MNLSKEKQTFFKIEKLNPTIFVLFYLINKSIAQ